MNEILSKKFSWQFQEILLIKNTKISFVKTSASFQFLLHKQLQIQHPTSVAPSCNGRHQLAADSLWWEASDKDKF